MAERSPRRFSKVYTRAGDDGTTGLCDGTRVRKDDRRLEACGAIDELNAAVGVALACLKAAKLGSGGETLERELGCVQQDLCTIQTQLLSPTPVRGKRPQLVETEIESLEKSIDRMSDQLPPLDHFILPGGSFVAAQLHVCRAICRRAERRCVGLVASQELEPVVLRYLNRLGDYFFTAARWTAQQSGDKENPWQPPN